MRWVVLLLIPLAGCVTSDDGGPTDGSPDGSMDDAASQDLSFDVKAAVDWWEHVATAYPKHDSNLPTNLQLRDHLANELRRIGLEVEIRSYAATPLGVPVPDAGNERAQYHVVIGTKAGTSPDRLGLVAHYDTQAATIHGAYDDASGVAAQFHICEQLAQVDMDHTLSCVFFDAEEQGLQGSLAYVNDAVASGEHVYDVVFGYDMTGINWPGHDWKMYVMTGPAEAVPLLQPMAQQVLHAELGYPEWGVEVLDTHDRNSDERRFKEMGIPIYRFAGGRNAADYPQYHRPDDTVEFVYGFVGARANFEAGFQAIVEGSIALALEADQTL